MQICDKVKDWRGDTEKSRMGDRGRQVRERKTKAGTET